MEHELELTAQIVSAYLAANHVQPSEIASVIAAVNSALVGLRTPAEPAAQEPQMPAAPAVPIKKSVTPDHIVCLEDGKKLKILKRHLKVKYNLSPAEYRAKWGLPADYPMVAPNYAARRSEFAKQIGLGRMNHSGRSAI